MKLKMLLAHTFPLFYGLTPRAPHKVLRWQEKRLNTIGHRIDGGFYIGSKKNHAFDDKNVSLKKLL